MSRLDFKQTNKMSITCGDKHLKSNN